MNVGIRVAAICAVTLLAVGCGGAKLDREGAARMALGAGQKGKAANASGGLLSLAQSGAGTGSVTVDCSRGGTASATLSGVAIENGFDVAYEMAFDGCTEPLWDDPETEQIEQEEVTQDGELAMTMAVDLGALAFTMTFDGQIDYSGAVRDHVEMDLTQTLTTDGGALVMQIDGSIETSTETHTYDNETWRFDEATGEFTQQP